MKVRTKLFAGLALCLSLGVGVFAGIASNSTNNIEKAEAVTPENDVDLSKIPGIRFNAYGDGYLQIFFDNDAYRNKAPLALHNPFGNVFYIARDAAGNQTSNSWYDWPGTGALAGFNIGSLNQKAANKEYFEINIYDAATATYGVDTPVILYRYGSATPTIGLSDESITVNVESNKTITATTGDYDVTWTSDDPTVATVAGSGENYKTGTVTGVSVGTTTIHASIDYDDDGTPDSVADCEVEVLAAGAYETRKITCNTDFYSSNYFKLMYSNNAFNPTECFGDNITKYKTTDGTSAAEESSWMAVWTANEAHFFVGANYFNKIYFVITFYNGNTPVGAFQYGEAPSADTVELDKSNETIMVGKSVVITASTTAESYQWTSSDTSNTYVTLSTEGKVATVTGVSPTESPVTITITLPGDVSASCSVTVIPYSTTKLATPTGFVRNVISDGGYLVSWGVVEHASSYKIIFTDSQDHAFESDFSFGNRLDAATCWSSLTDGGHYRVGIIAVGTGDYTNSDEGVVFSDFVVFKSAKTFAQYFRNKTSVCDATGASMNITSTIWNDLKERYNAVYNNERVDFKRADNDDADVVDAKARYKVILEKYSEDDYEYLTDFIGLGVVRPSSVSLPFAIENNASTIVILISVVSVITCLTLAIALKKRKHE